MNDNMIIYFICNYLLDFLVNNINLASKEDGNRELIRFITKLIAHG